MVDSGVARESEGYGGTARERANLNGCDEHTSVRGSVPFGRAERPPRTPSGDSREFDVDAARRFRASWPNKNIAARKKLEAFRAFFRFVHESGWIPTNPKTPLKPPKITPHSRKKVTSILKACGFYPDKANRVRLRAFVLLLRYSGLRIRDAATLSRNRTQGDKLFLYTAKTGTPAHCHRAECDS